MLGRRALTLARAGYAPRRSPICTGTEETMATEPPRRGDARQPACGARDLRDSGELTLRRTGGRGDRQDLSAAERLRRTGAARRPPTGSGIDVGTGWRGSASEYVSAAKSAATTSSDWTVMS